MLNRRLLLEYLDLKIKENEKKNYLQIECGNSQQTTKYSNDVYEELLMTFPKVQTIKN